MPAVSKAQQKFMGMVHATQKGDMEAPSKEVEKVADTMKKVDAKDFASTKHKGLPSHVKERLKEIIRGVIRAEGAFGSVIGGPEDGRNLSEMSPNDIHFRGIMTMYDKGGSFAKKKVAVAVSKNPNASRNQIIDDLKDLDYHEILDAEDQLGLGESVNEEFKHLISVETPTQVVSKPIAAQIMALAKKGVRSNEIGLEMGFVGNQKMATDAFQKVKNQIYFALDKRNESVNEGKKSFKVNPGIGSSKYSISSHDGVKKHKDGSDFYDIKIFKNKVDLEKGIKDFKGKGFIEESINEGLLDIIPYFKKKKEEAEKKQADILKRRQEMAYSNVKDVYDTTIKALENPKYSENKEAKIKACNDLIWTAVSGAPKNEKINWAGLKTSFDWDELNEFDMMDELERSFADILKVKTNKNESITEAISKDAVVRTLTSDKNAYFLTKDGNGWILDITPKAAQQSTFHQKFNVKDLGKGHLGMKYKLSESINEAMGNDKSMAALVDMLSNSMEYYSTESKFASDASKIAGFGNLKSLFKDVYNDYWDLDAKKRNDYTQKDWLKWLEKWSLAESINEEESHDCGCNENHDCGCGGVHEHTHIHEDLSADANGIAGLTASRASAVKDFLEKNNIDSNKLYLFLKKGKLNDRMDFVTALVGKPGNPIQKKVISQFSK